MDDKRPGGNLVFIGGTASIEGVPDTPLKISSADARRFMRRALLLDTPAPDVAAALAHHGFVQIDPINVCGRMHDLILRNRVQDYREGDLMRHVHGEDTSLPATQRRAFEHHQPATGNLVVFTHDAWPHLQATMRARTRVTSAWSGRLTREESALALRIIEAITARGPLASDAFAGVGRTRQIWGSATLAKATMQKLFFHGRLLIARRQGSRRFYDLPERVLPREILTLSAPKPKETARWEAHLKLRQRRLALLKRTELALIRDLVQPVRIEGAPLLHCLREDLPLFDVPSPAFTPRLIAPLDPLIYDRRVTRALWNFDYTWEVYTPPAKRVRGYYALPVLSGHELVGHVDPKADRPRRRLTVVSRSVRRGHTTADAVKGLAHFLGLKS